MPPGPLEDERRLELAGVIVVDVPLMVVDPPSEQESQTHRSEPDAQCEPHGAAFLGTFMHFVPNPAYADIMTPAKPRAVSSAGERCLHTAEVTGSIPVPPTKIEIGPRACTPVCSERFALGP